MAQTLKDAKRVFVDLLYAYCQSCCNCDPAKLTTTSRHAADCPANPRNEFIKEVSKSLQTLERILQRGAA